MTPEQFAHVRRLFEEALDAGPVNLGDWLRQRVPDDAQVRAEVAALLNYHSRAGSFLVEPVADRVSDLLDDEGALAPGSVIGTYTIEREIGRGGMGHVYLARDSRLGRAVALKALPLSVTRDSAQRERLRREARAAAALTHPGICTVFALEELNGDLFIVSEYVEGRTLREDIASGRRPTGHEVQEMARELAEALASAHAKGITHRDLKPENIMRTTSGRVKILDFGLARIESPDGGATGLQMTQPGTLLGTPGYMAPEQLNGQPADARADVFAYGVVIYEFACGVHPFEAPSALGVAARVLQSDFVPVERRCSTLLPSLVAVIERSLQKSPDHRFASAADIVAALTQATPPPTSTVTLWWRRHQAIVIALYVLASIAAWFVKEWHHGLSDATFLVIGVAATAGAIFRGHLMFTERMNSSAFQGEHRRARPIVVGVDLLIAVVVAVDGVVAAGGRPLAAAVILALAIGLALQSLIVEPATTAAAFKQ
jgi:predicted Ser/Thr protein kinase